MDTILFPLLPNEVLKLLLSFFTPDSFSSFCCISKSASDFVNDNFLWKSIYFNQFKYYFEEEEEDEINWKDMCKIMYPGKNKFFKIC